MAGRVNGGLQRGVSACGPITAAVSPTLGERHTLRSRVVYVRATPVDFAGQHLTAGARVRSLYVRASGGERPAERLRPTGPPAGPPPGSRPRAGDRPGLVFPTAALACRL